MAVSRTMRQLWKRSSPSIQHLFPLSELPTRKPESSQQRAISLSEALGGRSIRVAEMLKIGKNWQEIQEDLGLTRSSLKDSLKTIAGWGLETPELPTPIPFYPKLAKQLTDPERTDTDMQQTLDQIPPHFYKMDRHGPQPLLTTIGGLLWEVGFHYRSGKGQMQRFVDILTAKNIPLGEIVRMVKSGSQQGLQRYRFIATIHKERAREVLVNEPTLQAFHDYSVQQVAGPNYPCPSTYRLRNGQDFIPCGQIFKGLRITAAWRGKIRQRDFWTNDCPVPVFYNKRVYYCLKTQAETLKSFIQQKLPPPQTYPDPGSEVSEVSRE